MITTKVKEKKTKLISLSECQPKNKLEYTQLRLYLICVKQKEHLITVKKTIVANFHFLLYIQIFEVFYVSGMLCSTIK